MKLHDCFKSVVIVAVIVSFAFGGVSAFAGTNVYYEVWRNTADDLSSATQIQSWHASTGYYDSNVQANQEYYYWARGITAETVDSGWVSWTWPEGYATTTRLTLTCPIAAERNTSIPIAATVEMCPISNPYVEKSLTVDIRESDLLDPDVVHSWSSFGHTPNLREYETNAVISDYEPVTNTAEVYLRTMYGNGGLDGSTRYAHSPNVNVALRDYSDPAPSGISAVGDRNGIQVNWNASTGNTGFTNPDGAAMDTSSVKYCAATGHYYERVDMPSGITWDDAKTSAENMTYGGMAGHLVTITSQTENDFVASELLETASGSNRWIGGFQPDGSPEPAGGWQWITGESWEFTNWDPYAGQPDNFNGNQNRLDIWTHDVSGHNFAHWNDSDEYTTATTGYLVEYVPEPATMLLLALGGLAMLKRRR